MVKNDRHWIVNVLEYVTTESTATSKKVGAILVNANGFVIGQGYNSVARTDVDQSCEGIDGKTRPEVAHAEIKAISYCANRGHSALRSTLYCTIPPCPVCCAAIIEAGIARVVYKETYWSESNLHLLTNAGIQAEKFNNELQTTG
ncbi:MAG TPA: deaminase [Flavobacterium sp.]|nr:deaminase [Flavobacterium sp.]